MHRWHWWQLAMLGMVILMAIAACDIRLARLCYAYPLPYPIVRSLEIIADIGGGGLGVALILIGAAVFDRTKVSRLPRLVSASLGAGLAADIVKMCVCRSRPHSMDLSTATFGSTFNGLFPFLSAGSHGQSFPSGHAATATGLALILSVSYPRGRWFFGLLAVTVALSRVIVHAHFPTDIAVGAMLGGTWAFACHNGFLAPVFCRTERQLKIMMARRTESSSGNSLLRHEFMESLDASDLPSAGSQDQGQAA